MLNTMHCLQTVLIPDAIETNGTTCTALRSKAFETHAACYVNNGVCGLPFTDWLAVVEIVKLKTLFQSWDAFKATMKVGIGCVLVVSKNGF